MTRLVIFLLLIVALDQMVGSMVGFAHRRAPHGLNWAKDNWLLDEPFDVVIMGSSRAFRSYIPAIISESTGLRVFNAGQNGQYLLYAYALEQLMLERHVPKVIVLDILPSYIIRLPNPKEEIGKLATLAPFYSNRQVRQLLRHDDFFEGLKYCSKMYRYNSKILSIAELFRSAPKNVDNGYEFVGNLTFKIKNPFVDDTLEKVQVDSFKLAILQDFIRSAKDRHVLVIGCMSPVSEPVSPRVEELIKWYQNFFHENQMPFMNYADTAFARYQQKEYFSDITHMDGQGGELFSAEFAHDLKELLASQQPSLFTLR
ncbi:MAG: hypothetical protein EHM72_08440 [Calditrichaeota bacterium]|nr:MAG: hypothetical protein EHM72_08440 [Calditrichota bacterium]